MARSCETRLLNDWKSGMVLMLELLDATRVYLPLGANMGSAYKTIGCYASEGRSDLGSLAWKNARGSETSRFARLA